MSYLDKTIQTKPGYDVQVLRTSTDSDGRQDQWWEHYSYHRTTRGAERAAEKAVKLHRQSRIVQWVAVATHPEQVAHVCATF